MTAPQYYNTREEWLNAFKESAAPVFAAAGFPIPDKVRISIGFTSTGARSNRIGETWIRGASKDAHMEIFIAPTTDSDARIADILTHELVHTAVGHACGHKGAFVDCARAVGLEGKPTSTVGGERWLAWALPILHKIGAAPYAAIMADMEGPKKKQKTYLHKVFCADCGWTARVTATHILPHGDLVCPVSTCGGILRCPELDEGDDQ